MSRNLELFVDVRVEYDKGTRYLVITDSSGEEVLAQFYVEEED